MNEEEKYVLEIFAAKAFAQPVAGPTNFSWREQTSVDGTKKFWFSDEDVFDIEEELKDGMIHLIMRVMGGKSCTIGPFHSLASAKEAANRIWNYMLQADIHTQVKSGGYLGIVSRKLFPNL
jgi:hypothetical protein